jgi:two-component system sensor histidine kinase NblS
VLESRDERSRGGVSPSGAEEHGRIPATANPKLVRIEVSDTGIGIDTEDQAAIFERFFRVENRVHTLEGTGLGLSIVRNIIEKHHTRVHLVSEVGVGTTFWFDLTVFQEAALVEELPLKEAREASETSSVKAKVV